MKGWLLSLAGIAFLGVLVDILSPNKSLNKFTKSIFAVFLLFVIVSPIKNILQSELDFLNINNGINITDDNFLQKNNLARIKSLEENINSHLIKKNIKGVNVVILTNMLEFDFEIIEVVVDIKKLVLTENINHNNKYQVIINAINEVINIKKDIIKFYE